ncbi:MAG: hypothetical protein U0350_45865 [Caldilineaceae bacterium]
MSSLTKSLALHIEWSHRFSRRWQALWPQAAQRQPAAMVAHTPVAHEPVLLTVRISLPPGQTAVGCLAIAGELNRHTYTSLIEVASSHYDQGWRALVLDLRQTTQIELSGLFALLSIARLYSGQSLLDPEAGWMGLHWAAEEITPALGERVKLIAPSPAAAAALERANFCHSFTRYPDLDAALKTIRG